MTTAADMRSHTSNYVTSTTEYAVVLSTIEQAAKRGKCQVEFNLEAIPVRLQRQLRWDDFFVRVQGERVWVSWDIPQQRAEITHNCC